MVRKKETAHFGGSPLKRRVVLYLPTIEMITVWANEARKAGQTTSSFVQEIVQQYLELGGTSVKEDYQKRIRDLEEQNHKIRQENSDLAKRVLMLDTLTDRYEVDIQELKNKPYLNGSFEGLREFNHRLLDVLKQKRNVKEIELYDLLHIKPSDGETIKAINKQLDVLFEYGLVKRLRGGIQWVG